MRRRARMAMRWLYCTADGAGDVRAPLESTRGP